jgi:cytochrome c peroxidase
MRIAGPIAGAWLLTIGLASFTPSTPAYLWHLPRGLPMPRVPADNPMSDAKVQLGRRLFYDTRLSGNGTYACASCHRQARAFTDGRAHAIGSTGGVHPRSAMTLTNVAYNVTYGWADAALMSLEAQMAVPMFNEHPIELGLRGRESAVVARFSADARIAGEFGRVFPGEVPAVTLPHIVKAIAAFERTIVSAGSPFDRYLYQDDKSAMTPAALRGKDLFFSPRLKCSECHASFNLSGPVTFDGAPKVEPLFHNTALYNIDGRGAYPSSDRGLFDRTQQPKDMGRFRAPTLRNVAVTAPYMHDGSVSTLRAAIAHYARGGVASPLKSDRLKGFTLTSAETRDLVAFLDSLTDRAFLTNPALGPPRD